MNYEPVQIFNSTGHNIPAGKVAYASMFCKDDTYSIRIGGKWQASGRGVCLVTHIYATVDVRGKYVEATPYESTGTSYSQFAIVATGPESFAVTRMIVGSDDVDLGTLHPEPTEQQN